MRNLNEAKLNFKIYKLDVLDEPSDYQPEYFTDQEKKNLSLPQQPDLTQTVVGINVHPCYEYPYTDKCGLSQSCSEHHYDVPHLSTPQGGAASPSTSSQSGSVASSSCPATATPQHEPSSEKTPHSDSVHSLSSFTCSSVTSKNSMYNINSTIPAGLDPDCCVSTIATSSGCRLSIPGSGVTLTVPEGSLTRGQKEEVFVAVLREDRHRPKLTEKQTLLSPVVTCGPGGLIFKKPVIINFQHCASLKYGHWSVSVWCCDSPLEAPPVWQRMVTLGEETINTTMFTQLDNGQVYLVTDSLMRFCVIGESQPSGRAVKQLRLAVFGPQSSQALDYNVRVYTVEDTAAALQGVMELEKKLGGVFLDKTKTILFQDTSAPLMLTLEDIGPGWKIKPQSDSVEIPFHHIWNSTHNYLHCSFQLEKVDRATDNIQFRILASQKGSPTHRQIFRVTAELKTPASNSCQKPLSSPPRNMTITCSSGYSSGVATLDNSNQPFRMNKTLRKKLCLCLDPPNARGNDWRMLAQRLNVDRYINYFATKSSPTEHILDLWEARHRESNAITDLLNMLRVMGRCDAAAILEQEMGAWL
ncbi:hypothetical protein RUM43_004968 [Polyplax serrata]|uniref:Netrin receptor UNC5 n=1 Tax=Polyplax serrata TaxID=468196 RepID=A0AAN8XLZ5_POLSC